MSSLDAEPVLAGLKIAFLVLLYLFVWRIARGAAKELRRGGGAPGALVGSETIAGAAPAAPGPRRIRQGPAMDLREAVEPRLTVRQSPVLPVGRAFLIDASATIGRSPEAELRLEDGYASSAHARVFPRGQFLLIEDLGSTNGTQVNGRALTPSEPYTLRVHDTVRIGDTEFEYEE